MTNIMTLEYIARRRFKENLDKILAPYGLKFGMKIEKEED